MKSYIYSSFNSGGTLNAFHVLKDFQNLSCSRRPPKAFQGNLMKIKKTSESSINSEKYPKNLLVLGKNA